MKFQELPKNQHKLKSLIKQTDNSATDNTVINGFMKYTKFWNKVLLVPVNVFWLLKHLLEQTRQDNT